MSRVVAHVLLIFAVFLSGAVPLAANASPVATYSEGFAYFRFSGTATTDGAYACYASVSSPGTPIACNGSTTTPTSGATLNFSTTATGDFGTLKAGGSSNITGASGVSDTADYSLAYGEAGFYDTWTITGATGAGTLTLQYLVDGSFNFCDLGSSVAQGISLTNLDTFSFATTGFTLNGSIACSGTVSDTLSLSTSFIFGTPLDFNVDLQAGSELFDLGQNIGSSMDLSETALLSAIIVEDQNGDQIPFGLTTASGAPLFADLAAGIPGTSIPEPGSLPIICGGLLALAGLRRAAQPT